MKKRPAPIRINPAMRVRHALLEARDQTRGKSVKVLVFGGAAAVLLAGAVVLLKNRSGLLADAALLAGAVVLLKNRSGLLADAVLERAGFAIDGTMQI